MPTQESKAHHVGEWASLRNTSPEIAEAIFEVANYDEKLAEQIWEEGNDEVLVRAFKKPTKTRCSGASKPSNVKTSERSPRPRGGYFLFRRVIHHRIEFIDRTEAVAIHRTALQLQRHALRRGLQRQYAGVTQLI